MLQFCSHYLEVIWNVIVAASWTTKQSSLIVAGARLVLVGGRGLGVVCRIIERIPLSRGTVLCGAGHLEDRVCCSWITD